VNAAHASHVPAIRIYTKDDSNISQGSAVQRRCVRVFNKVTAKRGGDRVET